MRKVIVYIGFLVAVLAMAKCTDSSWESPANGPVHPPSWINTQLLGTKEFHGTTARAYGTEVCEPCHGSDLKGEEGVFGCYQCHFGPNGSRIPEGTDWNHEQDRHLEFEINHQVCNSCHALERSFNTGPQGCHNCHGEGIGHVLGQPWLDKKSSDFHGTTPLENCSDCHIASEKCAQCHFGETGSRSPPGSGWVHDGDGDNEDHREYERYLTTCNQCHKTNRSYANGPESCHDCHEEEDD